MLTFGSGSTISPLVSELLQVSRSEAAASVPAKLSVFYKRSKHKPFNTDHAELYNNHL